MVGVREQRKVQMVFPVKGFLLWQRVGADPHDRHSSLAQTCLRIAHAFSLGRSPRGIGLRVEIQEKLAPLKIRKLHIIPVLIRQPKVRSLISRSKFAHNCNLHCSYCYEEGISKEMKQKILDENLVKQIFLSLEKIKSDQQSINSIKNYFSEILLIQFTI
jgi:sulfatase maturation enzyme AslB (radical SAM superfamily)